MTVTAWRIVKSKHAAAAFTGEGARRFGGRWNSKGVAVVYTAGSPSLAALEMLVHLEAQEILSAYRLASVTFNESLVDAIPMARLPSRWRADPAPVALRRIGDDWVAGASSVVLRVPSAIIDGEWNYLLNPNHPDFHRCRHATAKPYRFDRRLLK